MDTHGGNAFDVGGAAGTGHEADKVGQLGQLAQNVKHIVILGHDGGTLHDADVIHIMHATGICDINVDKAASMSVTYLLCADSTVMVINDSKVNILPYSLETAKLIMLKELKLKQTQK